MSSVTLKLAGETAGSAGLVDRGGRVVARVAMGGAARSARTGVEPGRANLSARREPAVVASKHALLIRRCLSEPAGEFERCLSIAIDRMIDAVLSTPSGDAAGSARGHGRRR